MKPDVKKLVLLNFPYIFMFYIADKLATGFRAVSSDKLVDKLVGGFGNMALPVGVRRRTSSPTLTLNLQTTSS